MSDDVTVAGCLVTLTDVAGDPHCPTNRAEADRQTSSTNIKSSSKLEKCQECKILIFLWLKQLPLCVVSVGLVNKCTYSFYSSSVINISRHIQINSMWPDYHYQRLKRKFQVIIPLLPVAAKLPLKPGLARLQIKYELQYRIISLLGEV